MCRWLAPRHGGYRGPQDRDGRQPPGSPSATSRGRSKLPPPNLNLIDINAPGAREVKRWIEKRHNL